MTPCPCKALLYLLWHFVLHHKHPYHPETPSYFSTYSYFLRLALYGVSKSHWFAVVLRVGFSRRPWPRRLPRSPLFRDHTQSPAVHHPLAILPIFPFVHFRWHCSVFYSPPISNTAPPSVSSSSFSPIRSVARARLALDTGNVLLPSVLV